MMKAVAATLDLALIRGTLTMGLMGSINFQKGLIIFLGNFIEIHYFRFSMIGNLPLKIGPFYFS